MTPPLSSPLVECVPNFSEGRDPEVIEALVGAADSFDGAAVLDVDADRWHNRTVLTVVGGPEALGHAVLDSVREATERIDLNRHRGEHPRIGAADVVPFVPTDGLDLGGVRGAGMPPCVELANRVGRRVADDLRVPVFLYGEAARRPGREVPAAFRRGGFEELRDAIEQDPEREPDFGPPRVHPTAGASAVGARRPLVAFNVFLDTADVEVARRVARRVRASGGGLPAVQALGFDVDGRAQVSTNLLDVDVTSPRQVFEAVREEAAGEGAGVERSEVVGLAPERALPEDARESLLLDTDPAAKSLERRIREAAG